MAHHSIVVFCAHSDDQIFGAGGTLAKYAKEGKDIRTYVFSYGELSHPWLKSQISVNMRKAEADEADLVIGGKGVEFFGVKEGKFKEEAKSMRLSKKIEKIILEKKPIKIFTHSADDPHPDHHEVYELVISTLKRMDYKCDVYTFNVWNWISVKGRNVPKLVVDISDTFKIKIKALKKFRSQWAALITLMPSVYLKAIIHGIKRKKKFVEIFRKVM